jgi:hypothetical protein
VTRRVCCQALCALDVLARLAACFSPLLALCYFVVSEPLHRWARPRPPAAVPLTDLRAAVPRLSPWSPC